MEKDNCKDKYVNEDGSFKGGFDGCVKWAMNCRGLPEENAQKLCAYIGRKTGKIKSISKSDIDVLVDFMKSEVNDMVDIKKQEETQTEEKPSVEEVLSQIMDRLSKLEEKVEALSPKTEETAEETEKQEETEEKKPEEEKEEVEKTVKEVVKKELEEFKKNFMKEVKEIKKSAVVSEDLPEEGKIEENEDLDLTQKMALGLLK